MYFHFIVSLKFSQMIPYPQLLKIDLSKQITVINYLTISILT